MKEFAIIFETILTELNSGIYYNPLNHTKEQNEDFVRSIKRNETYKYLNTINSGKAIFHGLESLNQTSVLVFSYESFRFKLPVDLFVMSFKSNIKVLDLKESDFKKDSCLTVSEEKAVKRIKKVTIKKALHVYSQCVFFLNDIKKAFVSNGSTFVFTDINTNKTEFEAYNVVTKESESEENHRLNADKIKNVSSFETTLKITFDVKILLCMLKSLLLKNEIYVKISEANDLYLSVENLIKMLSFIPKKQSTIEFLVKDNKSCVHFFTLSGEHIGIMPCHPKDTNEIESISGIEESYNFALNYFDLSNNSANIEPECIESNESIQPNEQSESIESNQREPNDNVYIVPESDKENASEPIELNRSVESVERMDINNISESVTNIVPTNEIYYTNKSIISERLNTDISFLTERIKQFSIFARYKRYNVRYLPYFAFIDIDIGNCTKRTNKRLNKAFRIRNKSSTLNQLII